MPTAGPSPAAHRRRALGALLAGLLVPAVVLAPLGVAGAAGTAPAGAGAGAAAGVPGQASPRTGSPAAAPSAQPAADVRQPRVAQLELAGIDRRVLAAAPRPEDAHDDHAHTTGQLQASGTGAAPVDVKPAAAVSLPVRRPAELVAVAADRPFPAGSTIQVRVREAGRWTRWTTLHVEADHGPDPGTAEARRARFGSEPMLTRSATRVQVRIDTPTGRLPKGTRITLVDAPSAPSDDRRGQVRAAAIGQPPIITRAQWGANESWRNRAPIYTSNLKAGFVHHTASTSNYSPAQAAAQVRAIYAYHTKSLGHSDIDYNFVVDRFGRLYEGRAGGIDQPVLGGHTAGFNAHTFAVVALGNFSTFTPPSGDMAAIRGSIAQLFAWKLGLHGVNPGATVRLESAGYIKATRYPKGSIATLPAVSSHQMVNYTACPGTSLQAQLGSIRSAAAGASDVALTAASPTGRTVQAGSAGASFTASTTVPVSSWTAEILSPCSDTPVRTIGGGAAPAGALPFSWDLRDAAGQPVPPATYTVRVWAVAADGTALPARGVATLAVAPVPGGAWGPCANASRVVGDTTAGTSVLWGRIQAPGARTAVLTGAATTTAATAAGLAAAPLARSLGAPLLLTTGSALAGEVSTELRARGVTDVVVVGGPDVVPAAAADAVAALGIRVRRIAGPTPAATAAAVAAELPGRPAVLAAPDGSPAHAVAGAALAAANAWPLLLSAAGTVPAETAAAATGRGSVTVVAPGDSLPDAAVGPALAGLSWRRIAAGDAVGAGVAVAAAFPAEVASAMLLPVDPGGWAAAPVAAAAGVPVLFSTAPVLSVAVADALRARPRIGATTTPVSRGWLADDVLGATSRVLLGLPWAPPGVAVGAPAPAPRPASYKVARANASPEPVRAGRTLKVTAKVTVRTSGATYRKVPAGVPFVVQFRASGASRYATVATGTTTKGRATARAKAERTGAWRIVVGTKASKADTVRVRR
ncbi:MAG: N-acetylmuramoyl-L-alanine amidase [Candidatus Nanopelagicales bacterium]|jgi:hypothetical protein|nr:N-acetylmuramoyl-L-alanine amidase [Candidatus Nanopelagicales bacterium]